MKRKKSVFLKKVTLLTSLPLIAYNVYVFVKGDVVRLPGKLQSIGLIKQEACYATQIETNPDAGHSYMVKEEPYDVYKQAVMDAFPKDITEDSIKLSAEIPKQTLCKWAVKGKLQKISITVDTSRADKTIRVGILTSAHKRVYIEANGEVEQLFETSDKEFIRSVFIENTQEDTVKISGIATMLSDSEQNAGNTQR